MLKSMNHSFGYGGIRIMVLKDIGEEVYVCAVIIDFRRVPGGHERVGMEFPVAMAWTR
jgi:hypothetical protein